MQGSHIQGVKIPNGFATTSDAYWQSLEVAGVLDKLKETLTGLDTHNIKALAARGMRAREIIMSAGIGIPVDLWQQIKDA